MSSQSRQVWARTDSTASRRYRTRLYVGMMAETVGTTSAPSQENTAAESLGYGYQGVGASTNVTTQRPNAERSAAAYDALAPAYDQQLSTTAADAGTREAFRALVRTLVQPGSCILDFGCGTGVDAKWYADEGYRVLAYDNASGMLQQLRQRCRAEIRSGTIQVLEARYEDFLKAPSLPEKPSAVTANFAVLNLIDDVGGLFEAFATQMRTGGLVIASLLNPFCLRDARYRWWWRGLPRLLSTGTFRLRGREADTIRRTVNTIRVAARPRFRQIEVGQDGGPMKGPRAAPLLSAFGSRWWATYSFMVLECVE